jgi:hypothetical protein
VILPGSDAALGVRMDMEREVKRRCGDGHWRGRRGEERGDDEVRMGGKGAREMHGGGGLVLFLGGGWRGWRGEVDWLECETRDGRKETTSRVWLC